MPRRRKVQITIEETQLRGYDLEEAMRRCKNELVERIRKGYGDETNRRKIVELREKWDLFKTVNPDTWRSVEKEVVP